jgi:hypothetical protein
MQIRKLQRRSGETTVLVWPPRVLSGSGTTFVRAAEGVLKSVKRVDNSLSLIVDCEGRQAVGRLEWDQPPSLAAVEKVLRAHLGEPIKAIGYLDVR